MATGTMAWYGLGIKRILEGDIDIGGHVFKAMLLDSDYVPNPDTHDDKSDIVADEVTGTGWAAGGVTVTLATAIDTANNRVYITVSDINETTVTLTNGKHLVIYDDTHASKALIGYVTFDTALAPSAGPLTVDFDGTNGALRITY
jgi:hypothetical protein